jgi:TolA-binding protein
MGLKWALVGGIAAIFAIGIAWMTQQDTKTGLAGGGASVVTSKTSTQRVTDLETALAKPPVATSVAKNSPEAKISDVQQAPVVSPKNPEPESPLVPLKVVQPAPPKPDPIKIEHAAWKAAEGSGTAVSYKKYINAYPQGSFAALAKTRLAKLGDTGSEASAWQLAEQTNTRQGYERYLTAYPNGTYATLVKARLKRM